MPTSNEDLFTDLDTMVGAMQDAAVRAELRGFEDIFQLLDVAADALADKLVQERAAPTSEKAVDVDISSS